MANVQDGRVMSSVTVTNFYAVQQHWNPVTQSWDDRCYLYCGRDDARFNLTDLGFGNPIRVKKDTPAERGRVLSEFADYLRQHPEISEKLREAADERSGQIVLVCWCRPEKACHCDLYVKLLMGESVETTRQMSLFSDAYMRMVESERLSDSGKSSAPVECLNWPSLNTHICHNDSLGKPDKPLARRIAWWHHWQQIDIPRAWHCYSAAANYNAVFVYELLRLQQRRNEA